MVVARGEVWWYEHPAQGRRPYLVLTRTEAIQVLHQILAVPATTVIRGIPTEVSLDRSDGMPRDCVLSLDNVSLVRRSYLTEKVTALSPDSMDQVCRALRWAVAC